MNQCLFVLVFFYGVGFAAAKDSVAEQAKAIEAEVVRKNTELQKKFNEAKDNAEKDQIRKEAAELSNNAAGRLLRLAKDNPADPAAVDVTFKAIHHAGRSKVAQEAIAFVFERLKDNPFIVGEVSKLIQLPNGKDRLTEMAEATKLRAVKGGVLLTLAATELEDADNPRGKSRSAEETIKLVLAARSKIESLGKEYGDESVPGPKGTRKLSEMAQKALFFADNLTLGRTAPEIGGELLDGKQAKLSDYRGKVVVVDVWATWCPPCRAMIPHERELVEKMKDKPFVLLSVSADEKKETLTKFLDEEKMPWTHWWVGSKGGLVEKYQIRFYPTIYVLDAKGVIRFKHVRGKAMDEAVEELLKEAAKTGA